MAADNRPTDMEISQRHELDNGFRLECRVPKDLLYFEGHFTDAPVVAGVVQLKWVLAAIAQFGGETLQLGGMEAIKFHQLLFPEQEFTMEIRRKNGKWHFHISSGDAKIASGRLCPAST